MRQLEEILALNPDAILLGGLAVDSGLIALQARRLGYKGQIAGSVSIGTQEFIKVAGAAAAEAIFASAYIDGESAMERDFSRRYKAKWGEEPESHGVEAYDGMMMVIEAIKRSVGALTRDEIARQLHATRGYQGLQGAFTFQNNGEGISRARVGIIERGRLTAVEDSGRETAIMRTRDPPAADGSSLPAVRALGHFTLNVKLMAAFLAVALIPIVLLFCLDVRRAKGNPHGERGSGSPFGGFADRRRIGSFIDGNLDAIGAEAQLPDFIEYLSLPQGSREDGLEKIETSLPSSSISPGRIRRISSRMPCWDDRGRILLDTYTPDMGIDASKEDFFMTPLETGAPFASPVEFFDGDKAFIVFSAPVRDTAAGDIIGVLCMRFSAGILEQIAVHDDGLAGGRSYAILLDDNHLCLADGNNPDAIFKSLVPIDPVRKGIESHAAPAEHARREALRLFRRVQ